MDSHFRGNDDLLRNAQSSRWWAALLLLPLLFLSACGMPQPFRHTEHNPLLTIGSRAGAVVRPVVAAPEWLGEAMAEALRDNDVAAAVGIGNVSSYTIDGAVSGNGEWALLTWRVLDPQQQEVFTHTQSLQKSDLYQPEVLQRLIRAAAPQLAQSLVGPNEPDVRGPVVDLRPIQGAPVDGNDALTRAMTDTLRHAGYRLAKQNAELVVHGSVLIGPGKAGFEHVEVVWTVMRPGNALPVGTIKQANDLPFGTAQLSWQTVAPDVARGAIDGLSELIRQARASSRPN